MAEVKTGPGDAYIEVTDPGRSVIGSVHRLISATCEIHEFGQGTLDIVIPRSEPFLDVSYSSSTAFERKLSGYGFRLVYRGEEFFDGIAVVMEDEDAQEEGHALDDVPITVTIHCITWLDWFLGGRQMKGAGRAKFSQNAKADNVLKAMLRANMVSGGAPSLIEPPEYGTGLYDPILDTSGHTVSRTNFGHGWTVAVAADTGAHADTVTHTWDSGRSLADQVREFCRLWDVGLSGSWSGTTYTIATAATAAGSDLTASIKFTRENGGLTRFRRVVDRLSPSSVSEVAGIGRRDNQIVKYAINSAFYASEGLREMGAEVWRSASATDAQNESRYLITQINGYLETREVNVREIDGQVWGDFGLGDKVTIYDSRRALTVADYVASASLEFQAPGPWELAIQIGRPPQNPDRASRRSGGGGGGGGHGGGHPKGTDGESEIDPDDINSYFTIQTQSGDVDAESANHYLSIAGSDTADYVRARTAGVDSGDSDQSGTPDTVTIEILGDFVGGDVTAKGHVKLRDTSGVGDIWLLATNVDPGAGMGP